MNRACCLARVPLVVLPALCYFFFTICTFVASSPFQTALPFSVPHSDHHYLVRLILKTSREISLNPSLTLNSTHPCVLTLHNA